MSTQREPPPFRPDPLRHGEGVGDPGYLLAEVTELEEIARGAGFGTVAYLLECARLELLREVELRREERGG